MSEPLPLLASDAISSMTYLLLRTAAFLSTRLPEFFEVKRNIKPSVDECFDFLFPELRLFIDSANVMPPNSSALTLVYREALFELSIGDYLHQPWTPGFVKALDTLLDHFKAKPHVRKLFRDAVAYLLLTKSMIQLEDEV